MIYWIATICIITALLVRRYGAFVVRVESVSMEPRLNDGQLIIVRRINKKTVLKKSEIVVVKSEELGRTIIKRIAGLPGETIVVEGKTYHIPTGHYFLMGDNLKYSSDSRKWRDHFIPRKLIIGVV